MHFSRCFWSFMSNIWNCNH